MFWNILVWSHVFMYFGLSSLVYYLMKYVKSSFFAQVFIQEG